MEIICNLIFGCRLGIHDISRVEQSDAGLPRFNMPLELGLWIGIERFGGTVQRRKECLVLDTGPHRYQRFISDIGGQDIRDHGSDTSRAMPGLSRTSVRAGSFGTGTSCK